MRGPLTIKELVVRILGELDEAPADQQGEVFAAYESDQLADIRKELKAQMDALKAEGDTSKVDEAIALRAAYDLVGGEVKSRETAAAEAQKKLAEALDVEDEPEETPDTEETEEAPEAETVEEAPVVQERVPLAAAIGTAQRAVEEEKRPTRNLNVLVSGAGRASAEVFTDDSTMEDVAVTFARYADQVAAGKDTFVRLNFNYPEDRILDTTDAERNTRKLNQVLAPSALVAAGGICEPWPADFDHPVCSARSRPIRDGLPNYRLNRGAVKYAPAATVGDLADAITVWPYETDVTPSSNSKACPAITCNEEQEAVVDAIVRCVTVGNFQARFNPEFWRQQLDVLLVDHDRAAEEHAWDLITNDLTSVTGGAYSGTINNILVNLELGAGGLRSTHRLSPRLGMRAILPDWVQNALRAHLAVQNPYGNAGLYESAIAGWFSSRNITPIWSPDIDVVASSEDLIDNFPADVEIALFPEGTFVFGDGGTLDLGTQIVDSALNAKNNRQAFAETFETVFKRGCEGLLIEVPLGNDCICTPAFS